MVYHFPQISAESFQSIVIFKMTKDDITYKVRLNFLCSVCTGRHRIAKSFSQVIGNSTTNWQRASQHLIGRTNIVWLEIDINRMHEQIHWWVPREEEIQINCEILWLEFQQELGCFEVSKLGIQFNQDSKPVLEKIQVNAMNQKQTSRESWSLQPIWVTTYVIVLC